MVGGEDRQLVDLVAAALVDPNLHTDLRMRLARQIGELLSAAHSSAYGAAPPDSNERPRQMPDDRLAKWLDSVLVDPNIHTDMRMRVRREISELLETEYAKPSGEDSPTGTRPAGS
jgi:hypothetical protein